MDSWLAAARAAYFEGDVAALDELFPTIVRVDDPRADRVEGRPAVAKWAQASAGWFAQRRARVAEVATTAHEPRVVGEFDVELTQADATFTLPIALVVEAQAGADRGWLRIYHSHWPLLGRHVRRPPLLAADPDLRESDVVGEYQAALAAGDAARIVATFELDGCFREPAGPQHRVCGTTALSALFERFFAAGAGITLEHCSVTDDGVRTALEFNAVRWGTTVMPPQAGIAVYERGPSGRLAHARIYDDVDPPLAEVS